MKKDVAVTIAAVVLILASAIIRLLAPDALRSVSLILPLVAAGLLLARPLAGWIRHKKCDHDWQAHVRHRSHDVGMMADKCTRCGTERHYIG